MKPSAHQDSVLKRIAETDALHAGFSIAGVHFFWNGGIDAPKVSNSTADALSKRGLIDWDDRAFRSTPVYLTDKGRDYCKSKGWL